MNSLKVLTILLLLSFAASFAYSQDENNEPKQEITKDTTIKVYTSSNPKPAGIFIAPLLGFDVPMSELRNNSKYSVSYGIKLEYASISIYPIVVFGKVEFQKYPGSDAFRTANLLNSMETKVTSFGGGVYILLNKYLKSNFTMPFLVGEVCSYNVKRTISPDTPIEGIKATDSKVVFGAGLGFTLYIFDIITSYNFGSEYSALSIKTQFHFPVIKF
ncbi:MAG: hypothetical protein ACOYN6_06495 [Ignavibacteria bacterium]